MKRIGILTAGGDTPALNATIHGAVVRANQLKVEIVATEAPVLLDQRLAIDPCSPSQTHLAVV